MTVAAANDSSSNVSNGRRDIQVRLMSSAPKSPSQAAQAMENFQSKDHEFSAYRHRDTVDRAAEYGFNMEANLGCLAKGDDNRHDAPEYEVPDTYGMESVAQEEVDRVEMFSNRGEVSLDSVMQSNVPEPFQPQGRNPSHMNMPGGGKGRTNRYLYSNVHGTHPNKQYSTLARHSADTDILVCRAHGMPADAHALFRHNYSTESRPSGGTSSDEVSGTGGVSPDGQLTQRQKLQRAVKEYGSTVIVFHVAISLASLGGFYLAVSRWGAYCMYQEVKHSFWWLTHWCQWLSTLDYSEFHFHKTSTIYFLLVVQTSGVYVESDIIEYSYFIGNSWFIFVAFFLIEINFIL